MEGGDQGGREGLTDRQWGKDACGGHKARNWGSKKVKIREKKIRLKGGKRKSSTQKKRGNSNIFSNTWSPKERAIPS